MDKAGAYSMAVLTAIVALGLWILSSSLAKTDDPYANSPYKGWADKQVVMPDARPRFNGLESCCQQSEIVRTQFRVDRTTAEDTWWYLDGNTWRRIPSDIIHYGERAPNGDPVLFVYQGQPTCFWIPDSGI